MAKPAGRAASSDSPLDYIRPSTWAHEWSTELIEIVAALRETLRLTPDGVAILEEILTGTLIAATDLPPVPATLRNPPRTGARADDVEESLFDDGMLPGVMEGQGLF